MRYAAMDVTTGKSNKTAVKVTTVQYAFQFRKKYILCERRRVEVQDVRCASSPKLTINLIAHD